MKTVTKPWGKEEWLELNSSYCYKRIYINAGYKTSYQYHQFKYETNYIISGEAEVWLENDEGIVEKKIMRSGEYFNVKPPKKHRVIALTDIILQEVSTPEVDDVIRIEDDTQRSDGKIDGEHQTPAVLILTSGMGTRLESLTKETNKALLPINNRAIISHIIDKYPTDYEFIITLGYKGDIVKEYCELAFPNHKFRFVEIYNIDGNGSGPGYSTLKCKDYLQRPFYIQTCDCLIDSQMPHLDGNWLGVQPTSFPEKYSTVLVERDTIVDFTNKNNKGYDLAFIGLAGIWDYNIFWNELESNIKNGELVSAFNNPPKYPTFKAKKLKWIDTGNLDDLNTARQYFNDTPLSLQKDNNEITYKEGGLFIKFTPNQEILNNRVSRAKSLNGLIPNGFGNTKYFMYYSWFDGDTLYKLDSIEVFRKFLDVLKNNFTTMQNTDREHHQYIKSFYRKKTMDRVSQFVNKYNSKYLMDTHSINGKTYPSLNEVLDDIDLNELNLNPFYTLFHGDLQFDNIVYNEKTEKFTYIDWRESFAGYTKSGDVYYDLAKLYGGLIIPYDRMKNEDNIRFIEGDYSIQYSYDVSDNIREFKREYEQWILNSWFDLRIVKKITALIFLNMSPLHDEKFGKMLWFKSIEMLNELNK